MDILRFITAGNVDDGKSTLIGRLLYDTKNIKGDVLDSVSAEDAVNLAHITDGLRAEREQGITIDVAYKYFTTPRRKYIITDAPGHFQYTKNLVTGASNADVIIILIDALNGITEQTRRHALAASFLHISQVVVAINKMDLVGFSEGMFNAISSAFADATATLHLPAVTFIPISALLGDNVSFPSGNMGWYHGPTIEQYLERCQPAEYQRNFTRFVIQHTGTHEGAQLAYGKLLCGTLAKDEVVLAAPHDGLVSITKIFAGYDEVEKATGCGDLCLCIKCEKPVERGDVLFFADAPQAGKVISATLCWFDDTPLVAGNRYWLRIGSAEAKCRITTIDHLIDITSYRHIKDPARLSVNQFGRVNITTEETVVFDDLAKVPHLGRGILIDPATNNTAGAFTIN